MKRILIAITAIMLIAATLAGCAAPESPKLPRGSVEGGVYTSGVGDLTFTVTEGWKYLTDEEIAKIVGDGGASQGYVCDMYAAGPADSCVAIEYLDLALSGGTELDEVKFLDIYKEETNKLGSFEFSEYTDFKIGANTFRSVVVTCPNDNLVKYYYVRRAGGYMISITAILDRESDIGSLMANFS